MSDKSSVSKAASYQEIGAYWDTHDSTDSGEQEEVGFEVSIESQQRYLALDGDLSRRVRRLAVRRGISESILVQEWIRERLDQELARDDSR